MPFELEALVGHLYIVGGRAISTTPPGVLVEVAPRRAARGRELDTFFTLVVPSGNVAPTSFYQQMARLSTERFFGTPGSVTAALRSVFNTLNQNLFEHNTGGHRHYEASMVCAVLRETELFLGRVGPSVAILRLNGETRTFPEQFDSDEALFKPPLGVQPIPDMQLTRYKINSGTRLLLGDINLAELQTERLTNTLVAANIEKVLDSLKGIAAVEAQIMAVEFVPPDDPDPVPVAHGSSTAEIAEEIAAARAQDRSQTESASELESSRPRRRRRGALQSRTRQGIGSAARQTAQGVGLLQRVFNRFFPPPDDSEPSRITATMIRTAVVAIPVVIIAVVVLLWVGDIGPSQFEQCLRETVDGATLARSIDSSDRRGVLAAWQAVLRVADECETYRENDPTIADIRREGQNIIDILNDVKRREAVTLASFPNARISSMVIQGLDIYALDNQNDLVYLVKIAADGMSAARTEPIPNLRSGASVDGITLGDIIDIGFDEQQNAIVALDTSGVLVRCDPRVIMQCEAQRVIGSENWQNPTAITLWQGRLYVMDPAGNQLWRYEPSGSSYASVPTEYFTGTSRPDLANAVDFDINTGGTVYILFSDGVMSSYFGSEAQPFAFVGFPDGQELHVTTAQGMFLNDSPINTGLLLVSRPALTVFETTLAGTFIGSYQIFEQDKFALLTDIVGDPGQAIFYASSGNAIFAVQQGE